MMRATGAWMGLGLGVAGTGLVGALLLSTPLIAHLVIYANLSFAQAIAVRDGADPQVITGRAVPDFAMVCAGVGAVMIVSSLVGLGVMVRQVCAGSSSAAVMTGLPGPVG